MVPCGSSAKTMDVPIVANSIGSITQFQTCRQPDTCKAGIGQSRVFEEQACTAANWPEQERWKVDRTSWSVLQCIIHAMICPQTGPDRTTSPCPASTCHVMHVS
jgi:hypothetical protein